MCRYGSLCGLYASPLVDSDHPLHALPEPGALEQPVCVLTAAVGQRHGGHAGVVEQVECAAGFGIGVELAERLENLLRALGIDVELRERRAKRRPSDLAEGTELRDERQRSCGVQHPPDPGLKRSLRRPDLAQPPAHGCEVEERSHDVEYDCIRLHRLATG